MMTVQVQAIKKFIKNKKLKTFNSSHHKILEKLIFHVKKNKLNGLNLN